MSEIPRGAIRFNTDSNKPELWDGSQWAEFQLSTPNLGRSVDRQPGARGVLAGGYTVPTNTAKTSYINISSTGNSQDFGDLSSAMRYQAGCSSSTRGITFGGYTNSYQSTIIKTTIASTGSHATFGNIQVSGSNTGFLGQGTFSNQTRGIMFSGNTGPTQPNTMKYVTIASEGNTVDFGDMTYNYRYGSVTGSKTRAMPMGGYDGSLGTVNIINVITMSTTGNAVDFGDLSETMSDGMGTTTNGIRSLVHTRNTGFTDTALDLYSPISGGTTTSFGNLSVARVYSPMNSCLSSPTRGVFPGGMTGPASTSNVIDYLEFATEGNAQDFGDMHTAANAGSYFSSAHGGL